MYDIQKRDSPLNAGGSYHAIPPSISFVYSHRSFDRPGRVSGLRMLGYDSIL